jgi:glycosyltransferase involved in cell wall biosynthesis
MAAGTALLSLVDQTSDIAKLIKSRDMGYTLELRDCEELVKVILQAYDEKNELRQKGKNARKVCEEIATRKNQTVKYYNILRRLSDSK